MLRFSSGLLGAICLAMAAAAQDIDMTALEADIDARSSQYDQLIGILQGTDANRSLAAFDAMVETGNPTMIEVAVNTGLMATDSRLRARALWEALSRKDVITITVDTSGLTQEEKTSLNEWNGAVQTFSAYQRFAETQCINLASGSRCFPRNSLNVSGVHVDIAYSSDGGLAGQFTLDESGKLSGRIMNDRTKDTYPAMIEFR